MITPGNLRFDFVIFQKRSDSYEDFGPGCVMALPGDLARKVHDAARSNILNLLRGEDPGFTYTIDSLSVYEVRCIQDLCLTPCERFTGEGSIRDGLPESAGWRTANSPAKKGVFCHLPC